MDACKMAAGSGGGQWDHQHPARGHPHPPLRGDLPPQGAVEAYHPPPPPPPPPPPEEPPEKPEEDEELEGGGVGMVEAIVEAMEEEKPPMRSLKPPGLLPWYQPGL